MLPPVILPAIWITYLLLNIIVSLRLSWMYNKDHDERKLMFIIGILITSCAYVLAINKLGSMELARRLLEWCPIPMVAAFSFSVLNDRFENKLNLYYKIFLGIVAVTIALFLIPLQISSVPILVSGIVFSIILGIYQYSRSFDLSSITLMLAMPSYAVCFLSINDMLTDLAVFSGFIASMFLILSFEVAKNQKIGASPLLLQKELDTAKENFSILFNLLPDPAVIIDDKGNFLEVTDGVTKVTGFVRTELLGTNFLVSPILTATSKVVVKEKFEHMMRGVDVAPYEIETVRKDGKRLFFELSVSRIEYGNSAAGLVLFRDLTERYRLTKSVAEKEERFRDIAQSTGDWVWEVDKNSNYVYTNSVVTKILGYTPEEIIGKNVSDLLVPNQHPNTETFFESFSRRKKKCEFTKRCLNKSGKVVILETRGVPIADSEGKIVGYRGVDRDITDKKEMERKLLKSERLAAIGELAAMVAHDLRNPLQSISTATYCLEKVKPEENNGKILRLASSIKDSVNYSDRIVRDLLEYSAKIKLEITKSNPNEIISQTLSTINVPSTVKVLDKTKNKPDVHVDVNRIRRVCNNIIQNALDAMPNGGTLTINSKTDNKNFELSFSDTGAGMTKQSLEKIMTPFFTTKARGMGLGLSISKRVIDAHKGTINVKSKKDQGTTFTITLPLKNNK